MVHPRGTASAQTGGRHAGCDPKRLCEARALIALAEFRRLPIPRRSHDIATLCVAPASELARMRSDRRWGGRVRGNLRPAIDTSGSEAARTAQSLERRVLQESARLAASWR